MPIRKLADMVVYRDDAYYCSPGPSVVTMPDGEVHVFFRRHWTWPLTPLLLHAHPGTEQCVVRSADGGATWEDAPGFLPGGGNCPCVTLLSDGALLFARHRFTPVLKCLLEGDLETYQAQHHSADWTLVGAGVEVWRSDDRGAHWAGPYWIDDVPGLEPGADGLHTPLGLRGWPVELSDGTVGLPVYADGAGAVLVTSADGGRTWQYRGTAVTGPDDEPGAYNEWHLQQTPSGDLVAFIRCQLSGDAYGFLQTSRSSDGGRTWTPPERQPVWGFPHHALPMPSGRLLLTYGYRREPYGVRARLIDAECTRFDGEELVLRDDAGHWDMGYPHAALLPDGRAIVVYYFNDAPDGQRYIAASVVEEL